MLINAEGRKTKQAYWDEAAKLPIKRRLPSRLNVGILNYTRLLKRYVTPGCQYIEIGCAPGKLLAWAASSLKAEASGIDYSQTGIAKTRELFASLGLKINLYEDDLFNHQIPLSSFDVVASFGVIEHFDDPRPVVQRHIELAKPGGICLIAIPNYAGVYGSLQQWFDHPNLSLHNLKIMNLEALAELADWSYVESARAYHFGMISPWLISFHNKFPAFLAKLVSIGINSLGLLQPFTIKQFAPLLILELRKSHVK